MSYHCYILSDIQATHTKVGVALSLESRLGGYRGHNPHKPYYLKSYEFKTRTMALCMERRVMKLFSSTSEWIAVPPGEFMKKLSRVEAHLLESLTLLSARAEHGHVGRTAEATRADRRKKRYGLNALDSIPLVLREHAKLGT